jgi:predicted kinase
MSHSVEDKGKMTILLGSARAGKSTYAHKWRLEQAGRVSWDSDFIREELTGHRYFRKAEPTVFANYYLTLRALLVSGQNCIVDTTNTSKQSLRQLFEIDHEAEVVFINTPEAICIERAIATKQKDLIPVIKRMWKQIIQLANDGAGFDRWYKLNGKLAGDGTEEDFELDVLEGVDNIREEVKLEKIKQEVKDGKS